MTSEIVECFQRIHRDAPDRRLVFLPATDAVLTATDLWEAAGAVSSALDASRVNPRGLIVAVLGNRPEYLATFLACRMRNQPLCPVDASTTASEVSAIAAQLGASAVLTYRAAGGTGLGIAIEAVGAGDSRHGEAVLLKMTSGSSGTPRATLTAEHVLMADSRALMSGMHIAADDIQVAAIPLSHAYGIGNLVVPLFVQGTAIVMRDSFVPHRLPDDARAAGATVFPGVPFMFDHFAQNLAAGQWPPRLRNLLSAGAPLEADVSNKFRELFGLKIRPFYGTSETGGITFDDSDEQAVNGMVGTPLPGVTLELVPQDGVPQGSGRVLVRGASVITSYADNVDADSFVRGGFLTGDIGTLSGSGQLTLQGRVSSFVNVAGRKVQPDEVERVLRSFDPVRDVRVLGIADGRRGEQLVACLVTHGARPSVISLRQFCAMRLAAYKIPRAFVFVEEIPLTERGKTDRIRLRDAVVSALKHETGML